MNTFHRALLRASLAIAVLACFAATANAATNATVKVRIETPTETLFNGTVQTGARAVDSLGGNCDGAAGTANVSRATPISAAADAAQQASSTAFPFFAGYGGTYLCQVGAYVESYPHGSWSLKINNHAAPPPVGYVTGGDEIDNGDQVLWYFTDDYTLPTLDLNLPATATVGWPVEGTVYIYDTGTDAKSPAGDASVSGGGANANVRADGGVTLTFPQPGTFIVATTASKAFRGSTRVVVSAAASAPAVQPAAVVPLGAGSCKRAISKPRHSKRMQAKIKRCRIAAKQKASK